MQFSNHTASGNPGAFFSCSLEYLLMIVHDLVLVPSDFIHPDTYAHAVTRQYAQEIVDQHERENELTGLQSDD